MMIMSLVFCLNHLFINVIQFLVSLNGGTPPYFAALDAASARSMLPLYFSSCWAIYLTPSVILLLTSKGTFASRNFIIAGINCMTPCDPATPHSHQTRLVLGWLSTNSGAHYYNRIPLEFCPHCSYTCTNFRSLYNSFLLIRSILDVYIFYKNKNIKLISYHTYTIFIPL